jgi:hypothetical protein
MAQQIPNGMENNAAMTVTISVPVIAGRIPPSVSPFVGVLSRNSLFMTGSPFANRLTRMNNSRNTMRSVHPSKSIVPDICWIGLFML